MSIVEISPATVTVKLDGSGNGTAKIGPIGSRETWAPAVAAFSVSAPVTKEAQCKIYVGDQPIPSNLIDGSLSGSSGDSTGHVGGRLVRLGQYIWAVWTGGDPGAVGTLNVTGTKQV